MDGWNAGGDLRHRVLLLRFPQKTAPPGGRGGASSPAVAPLRGASRRESVTRAEGKKRIKGRKLSQLIRRI
ncbi:hypothetical protein IQ238_29640 [Pleurocapsales cyanobacterium LEGE 06147]|nr:hypothetical protein [Pleurocapsales cyanobacterium LEGE 06147]